ncbi:hypothetical protein [Streptomyces collinus]|uniref:hypothetical protein n=1 Tax=Streptomyces collinus TaxID=42684 RepID=UPI0036CBF888
MSHRIDVSHLTQLQLDGVTCAVCGQIDDRPMVPVGPAPSGLVDLHIHEACLRPAPAQTNGRVLVVGATQTPADVADTSGYAFDVADRLRLPATVAIGADYDVTEWEGVALWDGWEASDTARSLVARALTTDMAVLTSDDVYAYPLVLECQHCFEADDTARPVLIGDVTWNAPRCQGCTLEGERLAHESDTRRI